MLFIKVFEVGRHGAEASRRRATAATEMVFLFFKYVLLVQSFTDSFNARSNLLFQLLK